MKKAQNNGELDVPLNAIRAFVAVERHKSVTSAAKALGITQSSVSRHLAVLEDYFGAKLTERRGRGSELTKFGRLLVSTVAEPLDTICFTARQMRRSGPQGGNRMTVRTSLSTFAYTLLIPNLQDFSTNMNGAVVDVTSSLSFPAPTDTFDVLITRDLDFTGGGDHWDIYEESIVCVGATKEVLSKGAAVFESMRVLTVTSRPDILPTWLRAMDMTSDSIKVGARYDHHYLALPMVTMGHSLLVAPEIVVSDLIRQNLLKIVPQTRVPSGNRYRAYAVDRSPNIELSRAFCRWLGRLCKASADPRQPISNK